MDGERDLPYSSLHTDKVSSSVLANDYRNWLLSQMNMPTTHKKALDIVTNDQHLKTTISRQCLMRWEHTTGEPVNDTGVEVDSNSVVKIALRQLRGVTGTVGHGDSTSLACEESTLSSSLQCWTIHQQNITLTTSRLVISMPNYRIEPTLQSSIVFMNTWCWLTFTQITRMNFCIWLCHRVQHYKYRLAITIITILVIITSPAVSSQYI